MVALDKLKEIDFADRFTRADALRIKAEDPALGRAEREAAHAEMAGIIGRATSYSDLDFSDDEN